MAAVKPLTAAQAEARFGYATAFFKSDKTLNALYKKAVAQAWDQTNFQAALRNTSWYKARTDSQRQFDEQFYQDKKTYQDRIDRHKADLTSQAQALGINVTGKPFTDWLATQAKADIRNNASAAEIQANLSHHWYSTYYDEKAKAPTAANINNDTVTGQAASTVASLRQIASNYGYPAGDDWVEKNTYGVLAGTQNVQDVTTQMHDWAKSHYKAVADRLDGGQTIAQILDPYKQVAAQVLGSDKGGMANDDTKWTAAISGAAPLTFDQFTALVKTDKQYGYDTSTNAQADAYKMASSLRSIFQGD